MIARNTTTKTYLQDRETMKESFKEKLRALSERYEEITALLANIKIVRDKAPYMIHVPSV